MYEFVRLVIFGGALDLFDVAQTLGPWAIHQMKGIDVIQISRELRRISATTHSYKIGN